MEIANITYPWGNKRRINAASNYFRESFGTRIQKVTIDAGFTCPNRDGTKGTGGCAYCNNDAFNPSYCKPEKSVSRQIKEGIRFHENRYRNATSYLAYFQAYSNTYKSLDELKMLYSEALSDEKIQGLIIGTRPDCINEQLLEYLARLAESKYLVIEYGIESVYNKTLKRINRGHSFEESVKALELTAKFGIRSGGHFIFGLPGESRKQMLDAADIISGLPLHSIKLHQLQIVRGTRFAEQFISDRSAFDIFTLDEYLEFIPEFLVQLNPGFIIERLAGETQPEMCLSDRWGIRYDQVLQRIEQRLERLDYWQGKYYSAGK